MHNENNRRKWKSLGGPEGGNFSALLFESAKVQKSAGK